MGLKNEQESAGFLSRLLFLWFNPLLQLGSKQPLELDDLYELDESDLARTQAKRIDQEWAKEVAKGEKASLLKAILRAHGGMFFRAAPLKALYDILHFVGPFALHGVLDNLTNSDRRHGMIYAVILLVSMTCQTMLLQQYFMMCFRAGMHIRVGVMTLVYKKSLRISTGSRNRESIGQMVNFLSVDTNRIGPRFTPYAHMLWSGPLQIIVAFTILYNMIGVGALSGLVVMVLIIPLNLRLGRMKNEVQKELMKRKDERIRVLNEVFSSIRQVKFFAWESKLRMKAEGVRELELKSLSVSSTLNGLTSALWNIAPVFVSCAAFATMAFATDTPVTPARVFVALALFNILRFPLSMFPSLINNAIEARVALKRLRDFLLRPEAPGRRRDPSQPQCAALRGADYYWSESEEAGGQSLPSEQTPLLKDSKKVVLHGLKLELQHGTVSSVIGPVGCGKSSLLLALLGEMPSVPETGEREYINGRVSYAAQTPWLMNATLRENVIFGEEVDEDRYQRVLSACCLENDLLVLPAGDQTEIGEKGGQKARVAMARAVYRKADIYLFDDPLSAVDAEVGRKLFESAVMGSLLSNKTRVLVTHQVQYLEKVDRVIVLEGGSVVGDGSYSTLQTKGYNFSFLKAEEKEEETQEEESTKTSTSEAPKTESKENGAASKATKSNDGKLMTQEERVVGRVRTSIYLDYFRAMGYHVVALYVSLSILAMMSQVSLDGWLSGWTAAAVADGIEFNRNTWFISIYLAVLRSPVVFFDQTPLGRIINRFSKDQTTVDEELPDAVSSFLQCIVRVAANILVIMYVTWKIIFLVVPLGLFYNSIGNLYIQTCRELRRLDSNTKGPILAFFGETLSGVETVRAMDSSDRFVIENQRRIDVNMSPMLWNMMSNRWLSVRLETVGTLIIASATMLAVMGGDAVTASLAGLSITYALSITQTLSWLVRMSTETETQMNSVERVNYYGTLPPEAPEEMPDDPAENEWPVQGKLEFKDVEMRYRPELEPALRGVTFTVTPGERVGVVGRTGAGKTSLAQALFRMVELSGGTIYVDGVDISKLGLHALRSRIAIITQDPMLVSATVRYNMDPFNEHSDEDIWATLETVSMKRCITEMDNGLDSAVHDQGQNFSVGQRQLLCLGRALLRDARLMILDEATAAIDHETDELVQNAIRNAKTNCTMLTIAHRLQTVMDSDKIIVMDQGKVGEMGSPATLLQKPAGLFRSLVDQAGGDAAAALQGMARG